MKTVSILAFLLLGNVLFAQAPSLLITPSLAVTPSYQGTVTTYPTTAGNVDIEGMVLEVANGTTVAALGLSLTVDGPTGTQACLSASEVRPQPTGYVSTEWTVTTLVPTPFSVTPTSGSLNDDTTHYIQMTAACWGSSGLELYDFALIVVVGSPNGQGLQHSYPAAPAAVSMTISPTINSQAISGTVDVPVGTAVDALGLDIFAENGAWASIGVRTTISNIGSTGINLAEFCGYAHHSMNVPGASPSGVFDTVGTHEFKVLAWGLIIGLINQGGYLHWTHECMSLRVVFTINVVPNPTIGVADSQGSITSSANAAGDRDFGVHDALQLPTAWATIQISNSGNGDLTLGGWNFTTPVQGAGAAAFGFDVSGFATTVPTGSSCQLAFRLESGVIGVNSVWIELWHNDLGTANPFLFELKGEVTSAPQVGVSDSAGAINPGAAAAGPRDFGNVDVANMPTAAATITIANSGSADLHLGTPMLNGVNTADFLMILSGYSNTLTPGTSTSFDICFDAALIGVKSAIVSFTHDDTQVASPFTFDLAGVAASANAPLVTTTSLPAGMEGAAYTHVITAAGGIGALSFSLVGGSLPPGMQLSAVGELAGNPTVLGDFAFTVQVEDSVGATGTQALMLEIQFDPLTTTEDSGGGGGGGGCTGTGGGAMILVLLAALALAVAARFRLVRQTQG